MDVPGPWVNQRITGCSAFFFPCYIAISHVVCLIQGYLVHSIRVCHDSFSHAYTSNLSSFAGLSLAETNLPPPQKPFPIGKFHDRPPEFFCHGGLWRFPGRLLGKFFDLSFR